MRNPLPTPDSAPRSARPALSAAAAISVPRWPLLLLALAYLLPGFIGRDPWSGDGTTFGLSWQLARGAADWLHPQLFGIDVGGGWLPYWIGAAGIRLLGPWLGAVDACRLPFLLLLAASLALTWGACFGFALADSAQPVEPAFADPIPPRRYARAVADGALLSLLACLGLLVRGHQTLPELVQLAGFTAVLFGLGQCRRRPRRAALALLGGLLLLAGSGAPWLALLLALLVLAATGAKLVTLRALPLTALLLALAASCTVLWVLHGSSPAALPDLHGLGHFLANFVWFAWPVWPLALWALWRWRESVRDWHLLAPLLLLLAAIASGLLLTANPSPLMLSLPPAAVLAAFALPISSRATLAALDWFALMLFTLLGALLWLMWLALATGFPSHPAANLARLLPGYHEHPAALPLLLALLASLAWSAIVVWRVGRHRHPLWKGMVLSAGGVTLVWLLLGTLWLPALDYASSSRSLGGELARAVRDTAPASPIKLQARGLNPSQLGLMAFWSGVEFEPPHTAPHAGLLLRLSHPRHGKVTPLEPGQTLLWSGARPGEGDERYELIRLP